MYLKQELERMLFRVREMVMTEEKERRERDLVSALSQTRHHLTISPATTPASRPHVTPTTMASLMSMLDKQSACEREREREGEEMGQSLLHDLPTVRTLQTF